MPHGFRLDTLYAVPVLVQIPVLRLQVIPAHVASKLLGLKHTSENGAENCVVLFEGKASVGLNVSWGDLGSSHGTRRSQKPHAIE